MSVEEVYIHFKNILNENIVIAGGAVRDELMGKAPKDYDIFVLKGDKFNDEIFTEDLLRKLEGYEGVDIEVDWHKSEPFLIKSLLFKEAEIQIMVSPHTTLDSLLSSFDWNVSLFGYDGKFHSKTKLENIGEGKDLILQKVTFPSSSLRRGFRFSERFKMRLPYSALEYLCSSILHKKTEAKFKNENYKIKFDIDEIRS